VLRRQGSATGFCQYQEHAAGRLHAIAAISTLVIDPALATWAGIFSSLANILCSCTLGFSAIEKIAGKNPLITA